MGTGFNRVAAKSSRSDWLLRLWRLLLRLCLALDENRGTLLVLLADLSLSLPLAEESSCDVLRPLFPYLPYPSWPVPAIGPLRCSLRGDLSTSVEGDLVLRPNRPRRENFPVRLGELCT
jgi:hypothetical protein